MQMLYHRLAALKENLQGLLFVPQAFHDKIEDSLSWWYIFLFPLEVMRNLPNG